MTREWIRSGEIVWQDIEGAAVLVSPRSKRTWVLNQTAAHIWKMCGTRVSAETLARQLAQASGQELRRIRSDLLKFCRKLQGLGLLCAAREAGTGRELQACRFAGAYLPPMIKLQNEGMGFRGRPSSRGVSGPG